MEINFVSRALVLASSFQRCMTCRDRTTHCSLGLVPKSRKPTDVGIGLAISTAQVKYILPPYSATYNISVFRDDNLLILDLGRVSIRTELCETTVVLENATKMEIEQSYSRLHIDCHDMQILFSDATENWSDARKENDTDMHLLSRSSVSATYSKCIKSTDTITKYVPYQQQPL